MTAEKAEADEEIQELRSGFEETCHRLAPSAGVSPEAAAVFLDETESESVTAEVGKLREHSFLTLPGRRKAREKLALAYEEYARSVGLRRLKSRDFAREADRRQSTFRDELKEIERRSQMSKELALAHGLGLSARERLVLPKQTASDLRALRKTHRSRSRKIVADVLEPALRSLGGVVVAGSKRLASRMLPKEIRSTWHRISRVHRVFQSFMTPYRILCRMLQVSEESDRSRGQKPRGRGIRD